MINGGPTSRTAQSVPVSRMFVTLVLLVVGSIATCRSAEYLLVSSVAEDEPKWVEVVQHVGYPIRVPEKKLKTEQREEEPRDMGKPPKNNIVVLPLMLRRPKEPRGYRSLDFI
ncbi:unnamed protein product [Nezara viridula]|uniref:Uncharacterized protein n=1 Tax=Nezara viridula TaxID=85310 RepID=A0A9P0HR84_NEZVI|nr:unnamed protein product [Nezara viridula]